MAASGDKTLPRRVRYYGRFDLLIIDEFGFDRLERREYPESSSLLYKVIDSRSGRGSTALVTNVDFKEWTEYLVTHRWPWRCWTAWWMARSSRSSVASPIAPIVPSGKEAWW